jgi:hypothetical protein
MSYLEIYILISWKSIDKLIVLRKLIECEVYALAFMFVIYFIPNWSLSILVKMKLEVFIQSSHWFFIEIKIEFGNWWWCFWIVIDWADDFGMNIILYYIWSLFFSDWIREDILVSSVIWINHKCRRSVLTWDIVVWQYW